MEGFIVGVVRVLMWVFVILMPIIGFIGGGLNPQTRTAMGGNFNVITALAGGVGGFLMAVLFFGVIAILLKIEANTRR